MARKLEVEIVGDASSYRRAVGQADTSSSGLGSSLGKMGKAAALAAGPVALGAVAIGAKKCIDAASNLNESINAVDVVFGKASKQVHDFSKKAAVEAGLSMRQFNEAVTPIGASLRNVGFSANKAAKWSINLTKRAADMASVFNVDVSESLEAIQAGLRGEGDPLEKFGVGLRKETIEAYALQHGIVKANISLADLHMRQVAVSKTTEDAKEAIAKYGKGSLEAQTAIAKQEYAEKKLHEVLAGKVPAMTAAQKAQASLGVIMEQTNRVQGDFKNTSDGLANAQRVLGAQFEDVQAKIGMKLLPMAAKATVFFQKNWPVIAQKIKEMWIQAQPTIIALGELITTVVGLIRKHWGTIGPIIMQVAAVVKAVLKVLGAEIRFFTALLKGDWSGAWRALKDIARGALQEVLAVMTLWKKIFGEAAKALGLAIVHGVINGLQAVPGLLKKAVVGLFHQVIDWAKGALGISSPSQVFHEIGVNMIKGMVNGIGSMGGFLKKAVVKLAKSIPARAVGTIKGIFHDSGEGSTLGTLIPWAHQEGMTISSTTGGGHVQGSYHYKGRAIDVVGSAAQMRKFFLDSYARFGNSIKELFYDPMGRYIKNGQIIAGAIGGHSDHVHLALAKGGIVTRPTMALIGERGPEAVIPLGAGGVGNVTFNFPNYVGSRTELVGVMQSAVAEYKRRNGRGPF